MPRATKENSNAYSIHWPPDSFFEASNRFWSIRIAIQFSMLFGIVIWLPASLDLDLRPRCSSTMDPFCRLRPALANLSNGPYSLAWRQCQLIPRRVSVCSITPAGSSITECANKHIDNRQGTIILRALRTRLLRLRYRRSIGNLMPHVCTDSHGTIQSPRPAGRLSSPSNPRRLLLLVSAMSADRARTVSRVSLRISKFRTRGGLARKLPLHSRPQLSKRRVTFLRRCYRRRRCSRGHKRSSLLAPAV